MKKNENKPLLLQCIHYAGQINILTKLKQLLFLLLISCNYAQAQGDSATQFKNDLDAAMLSAYEGDRDAQFNVGVLFSSDEFQPADHEQAAYWYKQAARQGHPLAQYNLGHQYMTGQGVIKSEKLAMDWWLKAAKQGHVLAQFNIGRGYYLGIGLEENHKKSRHWFEQAALQQEPKSTHILQKLGWTENLPETPSTETAISLPDSNEPITSKIEVISSDETTVTEENLTNNAELSNAEPGNVQPRNVEPKKVEETEEFIVAQESDQVADVKEPETAELIDESAIEPVKTVPIAVYTDPKVNSVLITIVDDITSLTIKKKGDTWSSVNSQAGFPVWVHGDFLDIEGEQAVLTGSSVNARAVPIISSGTIIGRLDKGDTVKIISKQKEWYRVAGPSRFVAWAKTEELIKHPDYEIEQTSAMINTPKDEETVTQTHSDTPPKNDNEWLFSQPGDYFTLQLASFGTAEAVDKFISQGDNINKSDLHQFVSINNNTNDWTYFLYGSYSSREQAQAAKQSIGQKKAWIRQFQKLRQNRCVIWKQQLPPPKELNQYCR